MTLQREPSAPRVPASRLLLTLIVAGALIAAAGCGRDDEAAQAAYRSAATAFRARQHDAAAEAARRAVELDPDYAEAWFLLGRAASAGQRWDEAIEAYERTIELDPQNAKALNNLANVYFRQGRYDQAADWYGRAIAVDPDYQLALFHYGWTLRQLGRSEEAERAFRRCLELEANDPRARKYQLDCLYYVGTLRHRAGDYAQAALIMEQVLSVSPGNAEARYFLGTAYRRLGRQDEAEHQLALHREMLRAVRREPIGMPEDR